MGWVNGFKVVDASRNGLLYSSCATGYKNANCELLYKLNKVTKPIKGCGPLAVFENLNRAKLYYKYMSENKDYNYKIFKCKFRRSKQKDLYYFNYFVPSIKHKAYGDAYEQYKPFTSFATQVKLIEEVK